MVAMSILCENATDTDLAYLAGLYDGEGSITNSAYGEIQLTIPSADLDVLEWVKKVTGGGSIQKHILKDDERHRQVYFIRFSTSQTRQLAALILPYSKMERRRKVLTIAASFPKLETGRRRATDDEISTIIDSLNQLSRLNSPNKPRTFTIDEWRAHKDKNRSIRQASAAKSYDRVRKVVEA